MPRTSRRFWLRGPSRDALLDKMDYHVKGVKTEEERKFYKPSPYGLDDNS